MRNSLDGLVLVVVLQELHDRQPIALQVVAYRRHPKMSPEVGSLVLGR